MPKLRRQLLEQRASSVVDEDHRVLGVVRDERDLFGEEADVQGVEHRAHAGDGEVELEMAVVVPREGGDAVAGPHAEAVERRGEPRRARPGRA